MQIPYEVSPRPDTGLYNAKVGIWLFLASEVMLFGGLFSAYVFLRVGADYPFPHHRLDVTLGCTNTFVLIASSVTVVFAWVSLKLRKWGNFVLFMTITILCAATFMVIKGFEYHAKFTHYAVRLTDGSVLEGHLEDKTIKLGGVEHTLAGDMIGFDQITEITLDPRKYGGSLFKNLVGDGGTGVDGHGDLVSINSKDLENHAEAAEDIGDDAYSNEFDAKFAGADTEKMKEATAAAQKLREKAGPMKQIRVNGVGLDYDLEFVIGEPPASGESKVVVALDGGALAVKIFDPTGQVISDRKEAEMLRKTEVSALKALFGTETPKVPVVSEDNKPELIKKATTAAGLTNVAIAFKSTQVFAYSENEVVLRDGTILKGKLVDDSIHLFPDGVDLRNVEDLDKAAAWDLVGNDSEIKKAFYEERAKNMEIELEKQKTRQAKGIDYKVNTRYTETLFGFHPHHDEAAHPDSKGEGGEGAHGEEGEAGEKGKAHGDHLVIPREQVKFYSNFLPRLNTYYAIYFTLTGLHGLHVVAGAIVLAWFLFTGKKMYDRNPEHLANRVEVGGLFWHFVDLVWIFLFPILYLM